MSTSACLFSTHGGGYTVTEALSVAGGSTVIKIYVYSPYVTCMSYLVFHVDISYICYELLQSDDNLSSHILLVYSSVKS
jgi:hypothetical protein